MDFEKFGLTLYDLLGYLLPGFVLIFACLLAESTFLVESRLLTLSWMADTLLLSGVIAYFLGHAAHALGSGLKDICPPIFTSRKSLPNSEIFDLVQETLKEVYEIELEEGEKLSSLDAYLLADNYVIGSEKSAERDILMAREGFFKSSMVSFTILFLVLLISLFWGGVRIQLDSGVCTHLQPSSTAVLAGCVLGLTVIFWRRFIFFNRAKINAVYFSFLALRKTQTEK